MNKVEQARRHAQVWEGAATDFFEGALLGNGGLGVVVRTRPDGVMLHFGHTSVWDIRAEEYTMEEIGTFNEVFEKVKQIDPAKVDFVMDDPWYKEYRDRMSAKYEQHTYPRPFPCGTLYLFYDRRRYEIMGHVLDIADGTLSLRFEDRDGCESYCRVFVDSESDTCYFLATAPIFQRARFIPEDGTPDGLPKWEQMGDNAAFQRLPFDPQYTEEIGDKDNGFVTRVNGITDAGIPWSMPSKFRTTVYGDCDTDHPLQWRGLDRAPLCFSVQVFPGKAVELVKKSLETPVAEDVAYARTVGMWHGYWDKSGVSLDDELLEETWYYNVYFMRCVLSETSLCPGLYGNFLYGEIGTAWHSDYHMNYNLQQLFWNCFITNHCDLHHPYRRLIEDLLPVSKDWAKNYYDLPGAYYPHSAYPRETKTFAYPTPDWGWQVCETPWAVQSLWWHYVYTGDKELLRDHLFEPLKQASLFLSGYMSRPDARVDGGYHVFPTVSPELYGYGLVPGLSRNIDCIVDLALIRFVFEGYLEAVKVLGKDGEEAKTVALCRDILDHFPDYPTDTATDCFVSVPGEEPDMIQNTPNNLLPVFPGEQVDLSSDAVMLKRARNTWYMHRNEGGNDLVFYALQGARLGILDLERFKRQIRYCRMPNGSCTDRLLLSGGRYADDRDFDFMSRMGVWTENFALSAVVSNCLVHTHGEIIRFFPNWDLGCRAAFEGHLARGGVEVSAACGNGRVTYIGFVSPCDTEVTYLCPWTGKQKTVKLTANTPVRIEV